MRGAYKRKYSAVNLNHNIAYPACVSTMQKDMLHKVHNTPPLPSNVSDDITDFFLGHVEKLCCMTVTEILNFHLFLEGVVTGLIIYAIANE